MINSVCCFACGGAAEADASVRAICCSRCKAIYFLDTKKTLENGAIVRIWGKLPWNGRQHAS